MREPTLEELVERRKALHRSREDAITDLRTIEGSLRRLDELINEKLDRM